MKNNSIIKKIIIIAIFIIGFMTGGKITKSMSITNNNNKDNEVKPKIIMKESNIDEKIEEIRKKENIVFLGDSITDFYPLDDIYINLPIINSGISGYKTTDILEKMDDMVYKYNPTKIILLIGTNDLNVTDVETVENNITKIVENIKENRKNAKIYIESIYPVNKSINSEVVSNRSNEKIIEVNNYLEKYCKYNEITYIDMYSLLTDDNGNFDSKYTDDGLHANKLGYARISQVLIKYLYDL